MAYGQTGTGKTYTLGKLGKEDASERGIMVRALEDIISTTSPTSDCVEVSYLQLYRENIQDMLAPENINISINEDPKTGEVSLPGAAVVKVRDIDHVLQLLQNSEANRHAANTNMNTASSRSHAILMVHVRRSIIVKIDDEESSKVYNPTSALPEGSEIATVRKSKLLIVDLAGSERIDKSGSEGHLLEEAKFINLSLSSLGKCINALAENSPHIPTRESKLTRLLRDSFGGSARTSLIITIGPSARHHAETTSTVMFGQRAMKIVNMVKLKEEFDYESLCRKLGNQVDHLVAEIERIQKQRHDDRNELEKKLKTCEKSFEEAETKLVTRSEILERENAHLESETKDILNKLNYQKDHNNLLHEKVAHLELSLKNSKQSQLENSSYQKVLADTSQMYEKKITDLSKELEHERARAESAEEQVEALKKHLNGHRESIQQNHIEISTYKKALVDTTQMYDKKVAKLITQLEDAEELVKKLKSDQHNTMQGQKEIDELVKELQDVNRLHEITLNDNRSLQLGYKDILSQKEMLDEELRVLRQKLLFEEKQRKTIENELVKLKNYAPDNDYEEKKSFVKESISKRLQKSHTSRELISGQRATIAKICEEVGLVKIIALLASEDTDVQIHAVKVVANLAAEDINQQKIVDEGGLEALLMLLRSSQNTTVLRVASGAIANLAMTEANQNLVMSKGGGQLLSKTASKTDDPQTLRMVAGAIANLCGNEKLHEMIIEDGGIKALLGMVRTGNTDVIAQVARGLANFAKCESRGVIQGHKKGRSLLMEEGALTWLIANANTTSTSTRRHIELALCHLAQNDDNAQDFSYNGGFKELKRISDESTKDDIRNLAKKTLKLSPSFKEDN